VAPWELKAPGGEEGRNTVVAGATVDMGAVVGGDVEGCLVGGDSGEEVVEGPLPGGGMDTGGRGEDAVEVEQHRVKGGPIDGRAHVRPE
jgi:hypothetical protein